MEKRVHNDSVGSGNEADSQDIENESNGLSSSESHDVLHYQNESGPGKQKAKATISFELVESKVSLKTTVVATAEPGTALMLEKSLCGPMDTFRMMLT